MGKGRLEAFSDGVIAIVITVMVLELELPHGPTLAHLKPVLPVLLGYALSFVYVGIYWNNHHHLFQAVHRIDGGVLWLNLHLLFWLSLLPFVTAWVGEAGLEAVPVAAYGSVLFMCALAYALLERRLVRLDGAGATLARAIGADRKGRASLVLYASGIGLGLVHAWLGLAIYVIVAMVWFLPDRRIERAVHGEQEAGA
jgi:uncharacterized membrane protein